MALRRCKTCGGLWVGRERFDLSQACTCPGLRGVESRAFAASADADEDGDGDGGTLDELMAYD